VSEENKFGGPKKPRATFGDVMMGVRAGEGGEKSDRDRPRPSPRPEKTERPEKPEKKDKGGPLVVVRRASGAVETRTMDEPKAAPAVDAGGSEPAAKPEAPKAEVVVVAKPAPLPSVADAVPENESFAEMLEAAGKDGMPSRKQLRVGEKVKAKIFQLGADTAFVSIGGKSEAMIELQELKDDEGILRLGVGDEIEAHVVETGAKGIYLSRKLPKGAASMARLAEARSSGMPVEGLVIAVNKGGIEVAIGDIRAFCPSSQVDVRPAGKLDHFVGEKLLFRVTEVKEKNVVLSRRALLEEENKARAVELKKELAVGKVFNGHVTSVRDFGAFVDLGGLEGMIPVSEMSHTRVEHPSDVVRPGDVVEVEVIRLEEAQPNSPDKAKHKDRITLSLKARQEDPYKAAMEELKEGVRLKGKVVRMQPFGAFVELKPGVDGLIHISAMSERRIAHPRDVMKVGDEVEVQVEKLDPAEKKISLRLVKDGAPVGSGVATSEAHAPSEKSERSDKPQAPRAERPRRGQIVTGKVDRVEPFGVFIAWDGGKGMIPASETGTDRGTDLRRTFPMGTELKAEIIEINGDKLKLSVTAAIRSEERADLDAWKKTQKPVGGGKAGFGTLADKFKNLKLS
jgi:small subunit ribosomal protein S1